MLGYTFLILFPVLAPLQPRFPRAIFRSTFAYMHMISILASLFHNVSLISIGAILYDTNFGGI
jgi:hypothetical protein